MKKLIIIPAYNERESIKNTIEDIRVNAPEFDYVVINDCSKDDTLQILQENHYNYVSLPINLGIGGAVQTGYKYAKEHGYDMAVQVDGDGQHNPAFLNEMATYMETHEVDMVIGSRFIKKEGFQSSTLRQFGIRYFTFLIKLLTGHRVTDPTSGLRMANRKVIELFAENYPSDYPEPETAVTVLDAGYTIEEIPVIMRARQGGVSSITMKKGVYYMVKVTMAIIIERLRGGEKSL